MGSSPGQHGTSGSVNAETGPGRASSLTNKAAKRQRSVAEQYLPIGIPETTKNTRA